MTSITNDITYAGIDVGATELVLVLRTGDQSSAAHSYANTGAHHRRLVQKLNTHPGCIVCLEAMGVYSMDIAIALYDAGIKVMVVNPKQSHNFARALGKHSKTQRSMRIRWHSMVSVCRSRRPTDVAMTLQIYSRRLHAMTDQKTVAKNQLHALSFIPITPKAVLHDLKLAITQLEKRLDTLTKLTLTFIQANPELRQAFSLLIEVKRIAHVSAIALLGELLLIPSGLSHTQWVKFAGLDPTHFRSGTSVDKKTHISKAGNHYIRAALYMPALNAKAHDPYVKAYFSHLIAMGKTPLQAVTAVMRKLLHALHGMLTNKQPFDNTRFYAIAGEIKLVKA
jgi:transposase